MLPPPPPAKLLFFKSHFFPIAPFPHPSAGCRYLGASGAEVTLSLDTPRAADSAPGASSSSGEVLRDAAGWQFAPSGLRLNPIVRTDVPDEWVEMSTGEVCVRVRVPRLRL